MTLITLTFLGDAISAFVNFWVLMGMFVALMLPLFAIPYIFVKMGSVAGKVQAKLNSAGKGFAKEQYKKNPLAREAAMRKQARENAAQRRFVEGKGIGGKVGRARRSISGAGTAGTLGKLRPTAALGNSLMADQIDAQQRKLADERIDTVHRNMSGNVATALSEGIPISQLRSALKTDIATGAPVLDAVTGNKVARFTSAEDLATLEYLDRAGLTSKPDAALATAATRKLFDIENVPGDGKAYAPDGSGASKAIGPEIAIQNLASLAGTDQRDNMRLSEEISSGAAKHGYKNLAYGNVTGGTFTNYTEAGKTPQGLVDGGLNGVNKDMLDDASIQNAIRLKVARPAASGGGKAAQLEIIQQTMHVTKELSLKTLSTQINVPINELKAIRQSIASNGTVGMPPGW